MKKEEIISEIEKIKYLYRFKNIIRYSQKRVEEISTESDAEHIFGMMVLANYFLKFEEYKEQKYDKERIYDLILFHEMDELELGDINTYTKTKEDIERAVESLAVVFASIPENLKKEAKKYFEEYENQNTKEALFVFWLDKVEPLFHLVFDLDMSKTILWKMKLNKNVAYKKKDTELKDAGLIREFMEVLYDELSGCFYVEKK